MDTIFVPAHHEKELYVIIRNKFTLPASSYFEQNWKRFLDSCIMFLRLISKILTRKKHPKVKLQRLRKTEIREFGSLVHQINSF